MRRVRAKVGQAVAFAGRSAALAVAAFGCLVAAGASAAHGDTARVPIESWEARAPLTAPVPATSAPFEGFAAELLTQIDAARPASAAAQRPGDPRLRIALWPLAADGTAAPTGAQDTRLLAALVGQGGDRYRFVAREALAAVVRDVSESYGSEDEIDEALSALVEGARADLLIVGRLDPAPGGGTALSYRAVRVSDGSIIAVTSPRRLDGALADDGPAEAPRPVGTGLRLASDRGKAPLYRIGETLRLEVETVRDAWLYCFYHQSDGQTFKIFPNAFHADARIPGGRSLTIPEAGLPFELSVTAPAGIEVVKCFAADRDLAPELPSSLRHNALHPLPEASRTGLSATFRRLGPGGIAEASLVVTVEE